MFHKSNLNQTGDNQNSKQRSSSSLPKNSNRESIAVVEGPALEQLALWIESDLEALLERNSHFETKSSFKKSLNR